MAVVIGFAAGWATAHWFVWSLMVGVLAGLIGVFVAAIIGVVTGHGGGAHDLVR